MSYNAERFLPEAIRPSAVCKGAIGNLTARDHGLVLYPAGKTGHVVVLVVPKPSASSGTVSV